MASITLQTVATVPTDATLDITVHEDVDGDGQSENAVSQSIDDGTNEYLLDGFEVSDGNEFWLEVETTPGSSSSLDSATLDSATEISGKVTLDGAGTEQAVIRVIDQDTNEEIATTTTDSSGEYSVTVNQGLTVHVTVEYENPDGYLYNAESKPFIAT